MKLVYSLQFQGFRNPAVFALDYTHLPMASFAGQLSQVSVGWNYLKKSYPDSNITIMGDSNGATLGLGLILHIAKPAFGVTSAISVPPDSAVFISPVCQSFSKDIDVTTVPIASTADYMKPSFYKSYGKLMKNSTMGGFPPRILELYENPGFCRSREWWSKAMPRHGVFLMYGDEEIIQAEIEEMYMMMSRAGECRIASGRGQLHSWPIFQMTAGRTIEDREQGIEDIAMCLAHMALWRDLSFIEREDRFEQYVLRKLAKAGI